MNTKRKLSLSAFISTFLIVLLLSISFNVVYAYFSATAERDITLNFANIELNVTDADETIFTNSSNQTISKVLPGDVINFKDITISNTGTGDCYVLVKVDISISTTFTKSAWYNISGVEIDAENITSAMPATYLKRADESYTDDSANLNLTWTVPGDEIDNDYQGTEISVTVTAYALQAYLPDRPNEYENDAHYATHFIIGNYNSLVKTPDL